MQEESANKVIKKLWQRKMRNQVLLLTLALKMHDRKMADQSSSLGNATWQNWAKHILPFARSFVRSCLSGSACISRCHLTGTGAVRELRIKLTRFPCLISMPCFSAISRHHNTSGSRFYCFIGQVLRTSFCVIETIAVFRLQCSMFCLAPSMLSFTKFWT